MPETRTNDEIMADLAQRAAAIVVDQLKPGEDAPAFSETQIAALRTQFATLLSETPEDHPFVRKIRFGRTDSLLIGGGFKPGTTALDIEMAYDIINAQRAFGGPGPSERLERAFRAVSDAYYLSEEEVRQQDKQAIDNLYPRRPNNRALDELNRQRREVHYRAMDTLESGFGSQLVGAQYVGDLWDAARPESRVFGLIDTFEMTAPTAFLPVEVDVPELLFVSESTANNSSNYTTVKTGSQRVQVDAKKFVIHQMWSGEMEEDSIIAYMPFLRKELAYSIAHYSDSLVLNGDTTNAATGNINLDDADPADTKHYLAFDGIRHAALVDNTGNASDAAGALALTDFGLLRGLMIDATRIHDWGHPTNIEDLVYIADPQTADAAQAFTEVLNWKAYNNMFSILNGEVGRIIGHPIISSVAVSKTEADGKVSTTGGNNTKGQMVAFNRRAFKVGWRRRIRVEMERIPATDQNRLVASMRLGFGRFTPTGAASGIEAAAVLYNVTV